MNNLESIKKATKMNSHKQKDSIVFFCWRSDFMANIINAPFKK